jgi:hypothetical protein
VPCARSCTVPKEATRSTCSSTNRGTVSLRRAYASRGFVDAGDAGSLMSRTSPQR